MHLSPRQLAAMNGAALEESIIEQIAKLEITIRDNMKIPDNQPLLNRLADLEKKVAAIPAVDLAPFVHRLAGIEQTIANLPAAKEADLAPVMAILAKLEKTMAAQAQVSAASYEFDVIRDGKGKMVKITASKVMPVKQAAKQTLLA